MFAPAVGDAGMQSCDSVFGDGPALGALALAGQALLQALQLFGVAVEVAGVVELLAGAQKRQVLGTEIDADALCVGVTRSGSTAIGRYRAINRHHWCVMSSDLS